jgi:NADPH-dependent 2,4-dienoyl-CoA reductase/sulfur reductase-like enzyme
VGVRPRTALAEQAGLAVDRGVGVDGMLATSDPNVYAAGDVARYPLRGEAVRIEHWVHAERMGQCAAANLLGMKQAFRDVPFFWTQHSDTSVRYVGYAGTWDEARVDGDVAGGDATVRYYKGAKLMAAASVGRDLESLEVEAELRALI